MSTNDKSGPAFPVHPDMVRQLGCIPSASDAGMSLRDYFAAKAMQADLDGGVALSDMPTVAKRAYFMADEMLEERK